ncbi:helix-turn-helix transcriptional regulator [Slackia equolifaciens]|uniref:Helix-turn-helix transcriptional regulator n=1 Tax=Slackia equolifaciens TaxID=498718 RepID=A0A3N0AV73_9ACTN|nr:helix-turn-helix transcriptional regulator [Slackia equolifaciens]RNL38568.1 helix-turn-helix transcriptional regulator [Slackia equolifaciens]
MSEAQHSGPSWMRILGFACHQGCIFSLFYMGSNRGLELGGALFERIDLFFVLAFMCLTLALGRTAIVRLLGSNGAVPAIVTSAILLALGSLAPQIPHDIQLFALVIEGLLVGCSLALLYLAWATVLGAGSPRAIACEVFAATGFAAAICFACAFLPSAVALAIPALCALASAGVATACLMEHRKAHADGQASHTPAQGHMRLRASGKPAFSDADAHQAHAQAPAQANADPSPTPLRDDRKAAKPSLSSAFKAAGVGAMSTRMIAGAATFGIAAGFMESYRSDPGMLSTPDFPATLLILALFCIAVLQSLFVEKPTEGESLGSMYRIAMLVIMSGFLFSPLLQNSGVPGEAIVLAGYLGLVASFMSFFLVMARFSQTPPAITFAGGLFALYIGEAFGIAAANLYDTIMPDTSFSYGIMACAGLAILFAYLFLFTERDFRALSEIVDTSDEQERACAQLVERFGLSAREAEVLTLALKGRSNERIAQELFVAKSTADTHMRRIYAKCGVKGRQELIDLGERTKTELREAYHRAR